MSNPKPLAGIKVIELGTLIAGPFCTRILAEFGAEVIKIEDPKGGDPLRTWRKVHDGTSLWWYAQARNKKSVTVNLRDEAGQEVVRRLARGADVVVENFRPGALENWNIGWERLSALNPRLVMVRLSGFGQTGPYRDRTGFGAVGEAMGGMRYVTGFPDRPPVRVGISIGDSIAALYGVIGALMALRHRDANGGRGQVVDVALYEAVFSMMESLIPEYDVAGVIRERTGNVFPGIAPTNTYTTADGKHVIIAGNSDSIFKRLMQVIGRPDLAEDPALATNKGRAERQTELDEIIGAWAARFDAEHVLKVMTEAQVPASQIYSVVDIMKDPQYAARAMIQQFTLPDGQPIKLPGIVPKLSDTPGDTDWLGPALGEHTDAVLRSLGYGEDEIAVLRARGAV